MEMKSVVIKGFGSVDLIEGLKKGTWKLAGPRGTYNRERIFGSLVLEGCSLREESNWPCNKKVKVTVQATGTKDEFTVTGFSFLNVFDDLKRGSPGFEKTTFAGQCLVHHPEEGKRSYVVTVQELKSD